MHIWKVSPLIEELKTNGLSQKEQLKYFLTYSILMVLATDPLLYFDFEYVVFDAIDSVVVTAITIIGILYCYKINEEADGNDFILRFITLGLPITMRFIVLVIIVSFVYYFFIDSSDPEVITTTLIDVVLSAIFMSAYYYYFATKLKKFGNS
ncbi:hypothetical protein [Colwellia sp. E2M01]|uniref:hypothetical protein n=1 Tax=Colwellia sp. E2M01 TaxID=2841561 RepID=UPI001C0942C7|nr:hypothetical protein [Colwellia sp. E2M01]MBU2869182.1 hypothetical protein [Colwellia sp. E2M01]